MQHESEDEFIDYLCALTDAFISSLGETLPERVDELLEALRGDQDFLIPIGALSDEQGNLTFQCSFYRNADEVSVMFQEIPERTDYFIPYQYYYVVSTFHEMIPEEEKTSLPEFDPRTGLLLRPLDSPKSRNIGTLPEMMRPSKEADEEAETIQAFQSVRPQDDPEPEVFDEIVRPREDSQFQVNAKELLVREDYQIEVDSKLLEEESESKEPAGSDSKPLANDFTKFLSGILDSSILPPELLNEAANDSSTGGLSKVVLAKLAVALQAIPGSPFSGMALPTLISILESTLLAAIPPPAPEAPEAPPVPSSDAISAIGSKPTYQRQKVLIPVLKKFDALPSIDFNEILNKTKRRGTAVGGDGKDKEKTSTETGTEIESAEPELSIEEKIALRKQKNRELEETKLKFAVVGRRLTNSKRDSKDESGTSGGGSPFGPVKLRHVETKAKAPKDEGMEHEASLFPKLRSVKETMEQKTLPEFVVALRHLDLDQKFPEKKMIIEQTLTNLEKKVARDIDLKQVEKSIDIHSHSFQTVKSSVRALANLFSGHEVGSLKAKDFIELEEFGSLLADGMGTAPETTIKDQEDQDTLELLTHVSLMLSPSSTEKIEVTGKITNPLAQVAIRKRLASRGEKFTASEEGFNALKFKRIESGPSSKLEPMLEESEEQNSVDEHNPGQIGEHKQDSKLGKARAPHGTKRTYTDKPDVLLPLRQILLAGTDETKHEKGEAKKQEMKPQDDSKISEKVPEKLVPVEKPIKSSSGSTTKTEKSESSIKAASIEKTQSSDTSAPGSFPTSIRKLESQVHGSSSTDSTSGLSNARTASPESPTVSKPTEPLDKKKKMEGLTKAFALAQKKK